MERLKSQYCLAKHLCSKVYPHSAIVESFHPRREAVASVRHHNLAVAFANLVAQQIWKSNQISVVDYGAEIIAGKLLLQIFKEGKNFYLSENSLLLLPLVLFDHHLYF